MKRTENQASQTTTAYYLRSSVLGGQIITELNTQGQKQKGYVFLGGQVLARQENNAVTWKHENPMTGSQGSSNTTGAYTPAAELEPMGVNVGFVDPYLNCCGGGGPSPEIPTLIGDGDNSGGCSLDGMSFDCTLAMILLGSGAAAPCPNNNCNSFHAYADGRSFYLPPGVSYVGDGFILNSFWTGGDSEKLSFDDLEFGPLFTGLAAFFTSGQPDKKKRQTTKVDTSAGEWLSESLLKILPGFDSGQEQRVRQTLDSIKESTRCAKAFAEAIGIEPAGLIAHGIVIGPAFLLGNPADNQQSGITEFGRSKYAGIRGSSYIQAVTLRNCLATRMKHSIHERASS